MAPRRYAVFARRRGEPRWVRLTVGSLPLQRARNGWQTLLLLGTFRGYEMSLRPVTAVYDPNAAGIEYFSK